jgi:phosphopantothenoylcysteine decarboxylase/phosphopantothenate--cysteine ligase
VAENARKKLCAKNADLIVANDVTAEGAGFDVDTNIVTVFSIDGRDVALPKMTKAEVAQRVLDEIVRLRDLRQKLLREATEAFNAAAKVSSL